MSVSIMVRAIKRGTLTHATGNYHFDPDGFPTAQKRAVPAAVAAEAQRKGLIEILKQRVVTDDEGDTSIDGRAAGRAQTNRERLSGRDMEIGDIMGATGVGDTFATTHTMRDRTMTANVGTGRITEIDGGDGGDRDDEEAAAALGDMVDAMSGSGDAPPADADDGDEQGAESGSSRVRRAAARTAARKAAAEA